MVLLDIGVQQDVNKIMVKLLGMWLLFFDEIGLVIWKKDRTFKSGTEQNIYGHAESRALRVLDLRA